MMLAQVSSATLTGEVRDESGALVGGAKITIRDVGTGFTRATKADSVGRYELPDITPGTYAVTVNKPGFRTTTTSDITIEVNQRARLDFTLKVGGERDTITVSASVSAVQTDDSSEGYRLGTSTITELPMIGRNIAELVTLGPGAIPRQLSGLVHDIINDVQQGRGATALNAPINGARSYMNTYILDGAYNTDRTAFAVAVIPPMDSVQEFRIQASGGSAEFAQSGGGIIDVVTKPGTRAFHGSAFEFLRNEALDARAYFDNPNLPRSIFRQNQFGGSLGGPIAKSSTFFYASYEGLRGKSASSTLHIVPDATVRGGNFAGRNTIFDPKSYDPVTGTRQPFPNNTIPTADISPIAQKYLATYEPLPNLPAGGQSNYLDATPNINNNDSGSARVDHQFSPRSWLFARYTINDDRGVLAGTFPQLPTTENLRAQQAALGYTVSGTSSLNEARASFTRLRVFDLNETAFQTDVVRELGITSTPNDPFNFGLPYFVVNDFDTVTDSTLTPQTQRDNTWQLSDGLSLMRGPHTSKIGGQWINSQLNYLQDQNSRGRYNFTGSFTSDPNNPGSTGDAFADFLLGDAQQTIRQAGSAQAYLRQNTYDLYLQDDWHVSRRLTLNLGLRYEYAAPYTEARGQMLNLDYSHLPSAPTLVHIDQAGNPQRDNFAPRVGLAWRLPDFFGSKHETVFRAAYGIFYSPEILTEAYDLVRNNLQNVNNESNSPVPVLTLANGFPQTASVGFPSYYGLDPNASTPYMQQWNAGFQREILTGTVLELSYVGSKGTHLGRFRTFNTPAHIETGENLPPRPGDLQSLRTFPSLGPIIQRQHIANSSYNSLQIKAEKRFSGRLSFLASFVWSKSIDDADTVIPGLGDSAAAQDERNLRLERGLSTFNVGRRLSAAYVYNLPGMPFLRPVFSRWSTSGILTFQDGSPFNPFYFTEDFANSGTPNRPNVVPGQSVNLPASQRTAEQWFNPNAFSDPLPFTFGNAGRNTLPSPGNAVVDVSLNRRFAIRESKSVEFRAECFNLLNHPNWGVPGQYPDFGPFFGRIFTAGQPRRFQAALRFDF